MAGQIGGVHHRVLAERGLQSLGGRSARTKTACGGGLEGGRAGEDLEPREHSGCVQG